MTSYSTGLTRYNVDERFDNLLRDLEYNNRHYPYGNVDQQLVTIKNNLNIAKSDPELLLEYKQQLLPHVERLNAQLKRLVA